MHMLGESIFGNEDTELHKKVKEVVGADTHHTHRGMIKNNNCSLAYQYISKTDYERLISESDSDEIIFCKLMASIILEQIRYHFKNVNQLSNSYKVINDLMGSLFLEEFKNRVKAKGVCTKEGEGFKIVELNEKDLSEEFLECMLIKKKIEG